MNEDLELYAFANAEGDSFTFVSEDAGETYDLPATYKNSVSMPCYIAYNENMHTYSIALPRNTGGGTYTPIEMAADNTPELFSSGYTNNLIPDNNIENALVYGVVPAL